MALCFDKRHGMAGGFMDQTEESRPLAQQDPLPPRVHLQFNRRSQSASARQSSGAAAAVNGRHAQPQKTDLFRQNLDFATTSSDGLEVRGRDSVSAGDTILATCDCIL
jgi:hypothetical protein